MSLSHDAKRLGKSDLLKERDVSGGCSKVLSGASPAVGIDRVDRKETKLAEVSVGDGGGRLAAWRVKNGCTGGGRPLIRRDGAMSRAGALQRSRASAALPANPAFGTTESVQREGRISRKKVLEGQHCSGESGRRPCRRRRGKKTSPKVRVVPSAERPRGKEEAGSGSAKARRGNEIRARIAQVRFMVGVGMNFIKRKELLFERDMG